MLLFRDLIVRRHKGMFGSPISASCVLVALTAVSLTLTSLRAKAVAADEPPPSAVGPLMKLFQSGRLPAERQEAVVEMICNRGNEHDLRVVLEQILSADGFAPALRLKAMQGLSQAATTRKVRPAGDLRGMERLMTGEDAAKDPTLQQAAIRLASSWKDVAVVPALEKLALAADTKADLRRVAIDGLVAIGDKSSRGTLEKLAAREQPMPVRMQAVAGLAAFDVSVAAATAASVLADAQAQDDTAAMIGALLDRRNGSDQLAAAIASQSIPVDVAKRALRVMYSVGRSDGPLSDALSKKAGITSELTLPTPAEVAQIVEDVTAKGDPERGEAIFRRKDLSCMKCHSVSRAGGQVGPELSAVGGSSPVDYIVNSILNPNLAVKEQYVTRVFVTAEGTVLTGIVIDRDEVRVNIRDANGQTVTVPVADIDEEYEGKSLMPQGLTRFLTREELLDLARFVSELGKPGPYAVQQAKTVQRWRVLREPPLELTREVPHLENLRQHVLGAQPTDWDPAYGQVNGRLPLEELRKNGEPTVLILQGHFDVSAEGTIAFRIETDAKVQTWIDAESLEERREFELSLPNGRHAITLRVEVPESQRPFLRVELKTPDNSTANFAIVGGS